MKGKLFMIMVLLFVMINVPGCENRHKEGEPDVISSMKFNRDEMLLVVANREQIEDKEEFAKYLVEKCKDNSFQSVKFSTDYGYSTSLEIRVCALSIIHLENGEKTELLNTRIPVEDVPVYLRLNIQGRQSWFEWSYDGTSYTKIGGPFDTTRFSDEYCKYGEFTGTFVGITCADRVLHRHYADFDFFEYKADEA